jgi:2-dehydropantoate 2-reductase
MDKKDYVTISRLMDYGFKGHGNIKPSMLQDIEKGRRTEVDFTNGYVVRKGKEVNVETPANELVTNIVKQIEQGRKSASMSNLEEFKKLHLVL